MWFERTNTFVGIQAIGFLDLKRREEHYVLGQPNDTDLYRFELNCSRDLNPIGGQPARLIFRWDEEFWPSIRQVNTMFHWSELEVRLESRVGTGPLRGMRWSGFILSEPAASRKRVGLTLDYNTPSGLVVKTRLALPNVRESSASDYYDPFGRTQGPDNCLNYQAGFPFSD